MENNALGFGHFLSQADAVGKTLLAILLVMSVASWALIAVKGLAHAVRKRRSESFLDAVLERHLARRGACRDRHARRARTVRPPDRACDACAGNHYARHGARKLAEAGSEQEFLTRTVKKVLDEETTRLENGLTLLATVGATAPFVGLFGTVWGVYHALVAIGMSGAGTLDKVAGPVGEALIMTGIGLAVAIPAVIGYNTISRAQPRAGGQARCVRVRADVVPHARPDAAPAARRPRR